jgi:predicted nucleic acid-binding protein
VLTDCVVVDMNSEIKRVAIEIRQKYKIKTPDAIVAATAKYLQLHLLTADRDFKKIKDFELILPILNAY